MFSKESRYEAFERERRGKLLENAKNMVNFSRDRELLTELLPLEKRHEKVGAGYVKSFIRAPMLCKERVCKERECVNGDKCIFRKMTDPPTTGAEFLLPSERKAIALPAVVAQCVVCSMYAFHVGAVAVPRPETSNEILQTDIDLVADQAGCSAAKARAALVKSKNDIIEAIMLLSQEKEESTADVMDVVTDIMKETKI
jgi:hypothetical protein